MSELPITKKEYDYMVLVTDFISKFKSIVHENECISDLKFIPEIKGYVITYNHSGNECKIVIKKNLSDGLNIKISRKFYRSYSPQDNEFIINRII